MLKRITLAMVLVLAASSLATAGEYFTKHKKQDTLAGQPTEEAALVYVFRPAKMGMAIKTWSFWDEEMIGVSRASGYSFALVPPGEHLFWSKAENTSAITLEVEAGETYYFKEKIVPGLAKARVKLVRIDEAEATKLQRKCAHVEPTEEGRLRGAEIARNRFQKAEQKAAKRAAKKSDKNDG